MPGRPDLVFSSRRKIVFVNGCFWHNHLDCPRVRIPENNRDYWLSKLGRNRERDERNIALLGEDGWAVMVVWECQIRDLNRVAERLVEFLAPIEAGRS